MIEVEMTEVFFHWLKNLRDRNGKARIEARIDRMRFGNSGDVKSVATGITEMRINTGPGYRVYFTRKGKKLIVLLAGGEKSTQSKDIEKAKILLSDL